MKNNLVRTSIVASALVLMIGLGLPGAAAETPDSEPESSTDATASCVIVYPTEPGIAVDPEGCKDLIPTNTTAVP